MTIAIMCFSPHLGGMELDAVKLVKFLQPHYEVYLFLKDGSMLQKYAEGEHIPVIPIKFRFNFSLFFAAKLFFLRKKLNISRFIFFGASELKAIAVSLMIDPIPLIMRHGTYKSHRKKNFYHRWLYKFVTSHVVLCNLLKENILSIMPTHSEAIFIIPNAMFFYKSEREALVTNERLSTPIQHILHVGRIAPGKGQWEALELLQNANSNTPLNMIFVGGFSSLEYEKVIREKAQLMPSQVNITFTGHVSSVEPFYLKSQCFLFPSHGEGLPNAVLEAMSYGLPVFAFSNTVFPELKEKGYFLYLSPNLNTNDLARNLNACLSTGFEMIKSNVIKNIEMISEEFAPEIILARWKKLLE
jgi:glycosyltransferase involved in cell wall biosynthesis